MTKGHKKIYYIIEVEGTKGVHEKILRPIISNMLGALKILKGVSRVAYIERKTI